MGGCFAETVVAIVATFAGRRIERALRARREQASEDLETGCDVSFQHFATTTGSFPVPSTTATALSKLSTAATK